MKAHLLLAAFTGIVALAAEVATGSSGERALGSAPAAEAISVTLKSDGETWVSITDVQVPKRLRVATLKLLPGEYEVVGRRTGYRDVRKLLRVRKGDAPIAITVICTESAVRE